MNNIQNSVISELARANHKLADLEFTTAIKSMDIATINELIQVENIIGRCMKALNSVELVPVTHGEWKRVMGYCSKFVWVCSECDCGIGTKTKFCPYCGSVMGE